MIQDIFPHVYHNEMKWKIPDQEDFVLCYGKEHILYCKAADDRIDLPRVADLPALREQLQYLFSIDERAYYLAESEAAPGEGWEALPTGKLRSFPRRTRIFAAAAGESLVFQPAVLRPLRRTDGKKQGRAGDGLPGVRQHGLSEDLPGGHRRGA